MECMEAALLAEKYEFGELSKYKKMCIIMLVHKGKYYLEVLIYEKRNN